MMYKRGLAVISTLQACARLKQQAAGSHNDDTSLVVSCQVPLVTFNQWAVAHSGCCLELVNRPIDLPQFATLPANARSQRSSDNR